MIVRIWRTQIDAERVDEYEGFAQEQSLPMFRLQRGFLGVVFAGTAADRAVITFWEDDEAVAELERSTSYRETVERIVATGLLSGEQSVELLRSHGDAVLPQRTQDTDS